MPVKRTELIGSKSYFLGGGGGSCGDTTATNVYGTSVPVIAFVSNNVQSLVTAIGTEVKNVRTYVTGVGTTKASQVTPVAALVDSSPAALDTLEELA